MTTKSRFYTIDSFEWLLPTGDASKLLVRYSIADDDQGATNLKELSIVVGLYRDQKRDAQLNGDTDKAKLIVGYLRERIEKALIDNEGLAAEITITPYDKDFPTDPARIDLKLGEWREVINKRKMGFLSS